MMKDATKGSVDNVLAIVALFGDKDQELIKLD